MGSPTNVFDPPANPNAGVVATPPVAWTFPFTLPSGGSVLVTAQQGAAVDCSTPQSGYVGLYVDGNPVPHTGLVVAGGSAQQPLAWSAVVALAAGSHTAVLRPYCPIGGAYPFAIAPTDRNLPAAWTVTLGAS